MQPKLMSGVALDASGEVWRAKYDALKQEFQEFQESSQELEQELETEEASPLSPCKQGTALYS